MKMINNQHKKLAGLVICGSGVAERLRAFFLCHLATEARLTGGRVDTKLADVETRDFLLLASAVRLHLKEHSYFASGFDEPRL